MISFYLVVKYRPLGKQKASLMRRHAWMCLPLSSIAKTGFFFKYQFFNLLLYTVYQLTLR